jgi:predicted phosphodiesterase
MMLHDIEQFDNDNAEALRGLWFIGDVHGEFKWVARALESAKQAPDWLVFLGDLDVDKPLRECLAPMLRYFPKTQVALIFGNHDGDSHQKFENFSDHAPAILLHGQVTELNGIKVAGLGGNFMGRVWDPDSHSGLSSFKNKHEAMNQGAFQHRGGQRPWPGYHAAIYPDDVEHLSTLRADILVTHEAPSCHKYGFAELDKLARSMRVVRSFHGHHHDDMSDEYALKRDELGFDARAVNFLAIKNGLGEIVYPGPKKWQP